MLTGYDAPIGCLRRTTCSQDQMIQECDRGAFATNFDCLPPPIADNFEGPYLPHQSFSNASMASFRGRRCSDAGSFSFLPAEAIGPKGGEGTAAPPSCLVRRSVRMVPSVDVHPHIKRACSQDSVEVLDAVSEAPNVVSGTPKRDTVTPIRDDDDRGSRSWSRIANGSSRSCRGGSSRGCDPLTVLSRPGSKTQQPAADRPASSHDIMTEARQRFVEACEAVQLTQLSWLQLNNHNDVPTTPALPAEEAAQSSAMASYLPALCTSVLSGAIAVLLQAA